MTKQAWQMFSIFLLVGIVMLSIWAWGRFRGVTGFPPR